MTYSQFILWLRYIINSNIIIINYLKKIIMTDIQPSPI